MNSLLPYSMQDKSNLALEECLNEALNLDISKFILFFDSKLSDALLYEKAKMYHVLGTEGWNKCKNRQEKINLIKNSIKNHKRKGTIAAIKSVLSNSTMQYLPWHDYDGLANHFKIKLFLQDALNPHNLNDIVNSINEYKRLSSKMDALEIIVSLPKKLYLNSVIIQAKRTLII